jgi:putative Holliday junction resolvase
MGRVLGVDLGARRVGLALSDPMRMISSPLMAIAMWSESSLVTDLVTLCRERQVDLAVIGLPLSADGSEGEGCRRARRVAQKLAEAGIPTALQDERWTSRDAEAALRETGSSRRADRDRLDAMAASLILREYLEES